MKNKKAQTKMDMLKLIIGVIGFAIIVLTTLAVIRPSTTGNYLTGKTVLTTNCNCENQQVCVNNECRTQPAITSQNNQVQITFLNPTKVLGLGMETTVEVKLFNNADADVTVKPLTPVINHNAEAWAFEMDDSEFTLYSKTARITTLKIRTPENEDENGEYEITVPFQINSQDAAYNTITIYAGLDLMQSIRLKEGETLSQLKYYSKIRPCPEAYIIIEQEPETILEIGRAKMIIPFCNYGDFEDGYYVSGVANNYDYYQYKILNDCYKNLRIPPESSDHSDPLTCEVPLYPGCNGSLHITTDTYFNNTEDAIENNGWVFTKEGYCFQEPSNAWFTSLEFNNDKDNPEITATILNRGEAREITIKFNVTNTDGQEITVCEYAQNFSENEARIITCPVEKDGFPYSFWGTGILGNNVEKIKSEITSNEYESDNVKEITDQPAFEYINVGIVPGSLQAQKYGAKFSFQMENKGNKDKTVSYELWGKRIEKLTDPTPENYRICSGTKQLQTGSVQTIECELNGLTTIDCETEDGCVYDGTATVWAMINVEHQEAQSFDVQERIETNQNLFIIPIYEEVGIKEFRTPEIT